MHRLRFLSSGWMGAVATGSLVSSALALTSGSVMAAEEGTPVSPSLRKYLDKLAGMNGDQRVQHIQDCASKPLSEGGQKIINEWREEARQRLKALKEEHKQKRLEQALAPLPTALSPTEFRPFQLADVITVSPNTKIFRFKLDSEYQALGLTVASCLAVRAVLPEKTVIRPYTPISAENTRGYFDLIVKNYEQGNVSKFLHSLAVGASVDMKGPFQKLEYTSNMKKGIGMVAGGTGIAPMYQVIQKVLSDPRDKTEIRLVFANETEDDILLKEELDALATLYPNFRVYYVVNKPSSTWAGYTGFVTKDLLASSMPPPSDDNLVMVCGPPGMMDAISGNKTTDGKQGELAGALLTMGYNSTQVFKF